MLKVPLNTSQLTNFRASLPHMGSAWWLVKGNSPEQTVILATGVAAGFLSVTSSPVDYSAFTHDADETLPSLLHVTAWRRNTSDHIAAAGTTYVYAVHGRSSRTCAWPLDLLVDSNDQLLEVSPSVDDNTAHEYCLPSGGISAGLSGNIVILNSH